MEMCSVSCHCSLETISFLPLCPFQVKMFSVGDLIIMHDRNEMTSASCSAESTAKQSITF